MIFQDVVDVTVTTYDTDAQTVTVQVGTEPASAPRPMTPEESLSYAHRVEAGEHEANVDEMVTESAVSVDKLLGVIDKLNAITAMTNASVNQNAAAVIKDLARECKTIARQLNREARLTSGKTDSTDTGTVVDT